MKFLNWVKWFRNRSDLRDRNCYEDVRPELNIFSVNSRKKERIRQWMEHIYRKVDRYQPIERICVGRPLQRWLQWRRNRLPWKEDDDDNIFIKCVRFILFFIWLDVILFYFYRQNIPNEKSLLAVQDLQVLLLRGYHVWDASMIQ